jgi:hypothetical protein
MTDALPYLLQDLQPAGFLGRQIPAQHPQLNVPPRIGEWNDAHTLEYLVHFGSDLPGDLVLGEEALARSVCPQASVAAMAPQERADCYAQLVETVQIGGSPAPVHGEQPKFTVRLTGSEPTSLIVKFSPLLKDPAGRRWADLLVAEHLALETLSDAGLPAARSAILESAGRCYLEVQRFDRVGSTGRRGMVSLLAVDAARFGELDRWSRAAARLCAEQALSREDVERVRRLEAFAILIRNTDRHFGNLSLFDDYTGVFALAPIYDMLPMAYAPHADGHVPDAANPPLPTAETADGWSDSLRLAKAYWRRVAEDTRVSASFRDLADRHAAE